MPALVLLAAAACATAPRWTPESVAPPPSLDAALEKAGPLAAPADPPKLPLPPEEATVLPLTRDGAILTALANNLSLEVAEFGPPIAATAVREARAIFDPVLTGTASNGRTTSQLGGVSRFTFGQALGGATGTGLGSLIGATPEETTANTLTALTALAAQPDIDPFLVQRNAQGTATVATYLPTGTQVFLTGTANWSDTNFTDEEYLGSWAAGVNQALLRGAGPAVNLALLRQAQNRAAQSRYALRDEILETVGQVETAYWELVLTRELLRIREFGVRLAVEQLEVNTNLVEVGRAVEGIVMSAAAEVATRRADLVDAQAAQRQQTLDLVRLLNPEAAEPDEVIFEPVDPPEVAKVDVFPDVSEELGLMYRPELAQARLELANQDLEVVRTKNGLLPRLDAFASYGRTSLGEDWSGARAFLDEDDFDNYRYGLEVQVPILNRAERARYTRARLSQAQAESSIDNLELVISTVIHKAAVNVERWWQRIGATWEAVQARREELRVIQDRYSVGLATNLDVLEVQRFFIAAQVEEATARVRYIQALVALYRAEGTLLDRRGIALDMASDEPLKAYQTPPPSPAPAPAAEPAPGAAPEPAAAPPTEPAPADAPQAESPLPEEPVTAPDASSDK